MTPNIVQRNRKVGEPKTYRTLGDRDAGFAKVKNNAKLPRWVVEIEALLPSPAPFAAGFEWWKQPRGAPPLELATGDPVTP